MAKNRKENDRRRVYEEDKRYLAQQYYEDQNQGRRETDYVRFSRIDTQDPYATKRPKQSRPSSAGSKAKRQRTGNTSARRRKKSRTLVHPERLMVFIILILLVIALLAVLWNRRRNNAGSSGNEAVTPVNSVVQVIPGQASSAGGSIKPVSAIGPDSLDEQIAGYLGAILNTNLQNISVQQALNNKLEGGQENVIDVSQYRYVVGIDAAAGGVNKGNVGGSVSEKDVTLKVARMMADDLNSRGSEFYFVLLRDSDINMTDAQRVTAAEAYDVDLIVSVHVNGSEMEIGGTTADYWTTDVKEEDDEARVEACKELCDQLMKAAADGIGTWSRGEIGIEQNNTLLQTTKIPAVAVYMGFATYPMDQELLSDDENLTKAAKNMADVIYTFVKENAPEKTKGERPSRRPESDSDSSGNGGSSSTDTDQSEADQSSNYE